MYIKRLEINNIRSVEKGVLSFDKPAGWHVLLGDNGVGKSSLVRAISAALIGPSEVLRLDPVFGTWVKNGQEKAKIELVLQRDKDLDKRSGRGGAKGGVKDVDEVICDTIIEQSEGNGGTWKFKDALPKKDGAHPDYYNWGTGEGWFSAAFGPYRRFTGGDQSMEAFYLRNPKIGAHLTAFKENVALTETVVWLKDLQFRSLTRNNSDESKVLKGIVHFTNQKDLLPEGYSLKEITPDGPLFAIPDGTSVHLYELSEGIKSVTSLAFELIRLLVRAYGAERVFANFLNQDIQNPTVDLPGVVLIDEIDVHLHPVWQVRIGKWFTHCFPNVQFIVTTHSPLICRAAVKGSIWKLEAGADGTTSIYALEERKLTDLLYGDVLDAYGTGMFGIDITRSEEGADKLQRLAALNILYYRDELTPQQKAEREGLLRIFPINDSIFS